MAKDVKFDAAEWEGMIRQIDKHVKNPAPILKAAFSTRGFRDVIQHFQQATGPQGAWKPLSPVTIARRTKGSGQGSAQPLQDTGNLRKGFLPSNVDKRDNHSIVFFNPVPYAAVHDEGSDRVPQREFMWLGNEAQEDMLNIILDQVIK